MAGVKVSEYTVAATLNGTDKIPLGTGIRKATTPDQLSAFVGADIAAQSAQNVLLTEDFVDIEAIKPITTPDNYASIPAATLTASGLNWAGAVKIADATSGGYIRFLPIIDGIAATAYTFDLTKGELDFATVTYVPSTSPAPATGFDRTYVLGGVYRDQPQDNAPLNRIIAAVLWTPTNPNFRFYANDGALILDTGVAALQNTEYHVEIKLNGSTCTVYINRVLVLTTTITLPTNTSVVAGVGVFTGFFGGTPGAGGVDIWVDWYGLKYTPNVERAVGFN